MELYVEKSTSGQYGLIDTFINESVSLNTKTTYTQDITAVFKGFTNSFSVQATPNNIKLLGYFGYSDQLQPTNVQKRAKLYLDGNLFKEGILTIEGASWVNSSPSLFQISFSDGQKNLTEILGEDTLAMLGGDDGNIVWSTKNIQNALQSIQTGTGGIRWFIPLVSVDRIFSIDAGVDALETDNINYEIGKSIDSENVLLPNEIRPALFISEILGQINKKYDIKIDPTPYIGNNTQLTDLATMCVGADIAIKEVKASLDFTGWTYDQWHNDRFDIIPKPLIDAFELNYTGYGGGLFHDANFDMIIQLSKKAGTLGLLGIVTGTENANKNYINSLEVWEVDSLGNKKKKLNYSVKEGAESKSAELRIRIGLDVFTPDGGSSPSTLVKPLISIFVSSTYLSEWKFTNVTFFWHTSSWKKFTINNVQNSVTPTTVNLFESLSEMKTIDFVKSIYTMFGYKKFKDKVLNDFYYTKKTIGTTLHSAAKNENDLTPFADLSKLTRKTNTKYDGYNLKHVTSEYQQNIAFNLANNQEYGQLKYPPTGKPKSEFKIETKFTAPVFNPILTDADADVYTFYPFGSEAQLNDLETRFIYDTVTKEFPIFYHNGVVNISTPYAFVDTDLKVLKSIGKYHKISHRSNRIFTGIDNFISSLFNIITGDYIDQQTLYRQGYQTYIEGTLSGKNLINTIDLDLPSVEIQKFNDSDEIIIKENKYTILESNISLNDGKTKLTLLNK